MKYLFFDIECCDGRHICEFGYLLTDEHFRVLERDCIKINPEHEFNLGGKDGRWEISLAFSEEEYCASPTFAHYYEKIKSIIQMPDTQIVGFAMKNDAIFLSVACKRYGLEPIRFAYLDLQSLYRGYAKTSNYTSIEKLVAELGIEGVTLHKSDDDSYAVMRILQYISEREGVGIADTLTLLQKKNGSFRAERARKKCRGKRAAGEGIKEEPKSKNQQKATN